MLNLLVSRRTPLFPSLNARQTLTRPLQALLRLEQERCALPSVGDVEISLVLCDDPFIRDLNARYRRIDAATDVLSFPQDDPRLLGDIVVSLETAARQAVAAGWPLENEVALLAVHGLLHLIGYDDRTAGEARRMQERSLEALQAAGLELPADRQAHPYLVSDSGAE